MHGTRLLPFLALAVAASTSLAAPDGVYRFTLHKAVDTEGTGMLAGTYLVPQGWKATDKITWMPLNYGTPCVGRSDVVSPDGEMTLTRVSALSFNYGQSTMGRNGIFPPPSVAQLLVQLWAREHPGAQIEMIDKSESPKHQQMGQYLTYNYDGSVKFAFDRNGQRMVVKAYGRIDGYQVRPVGAAMVTEGQWTISNIMAATAPEARLASAMKLFGFSLASYRIDPHFFSVVLQVQQGAIRNAYNSSENALTLSRHLAANQQRISADIMSVYENRVKAMDGMNLKFDDYIRGMDDYVAGGKHFTIPYGYKHVWVSNDGKEYMATNKDNVTPGSGFQRAAPSGG